MKVNNGTSQATVQTPETTKKIKPLASPSVPKELKDKNVANADTQTTISAKAQEMATAKQIAMQTPDVREEKVAAIKKHIQDGTYAIDSQLVADKLVAEHLNTIG